MIDIFWILNLDRMLKPNGRDLIYTLLGNFLQRQKNLRKDSVRLAGLETGMRNAGPPERAAGVLRYRPPCWIHIPLGCSVFQRKAWRSALQLGYLKPLREDTKDCLAKWHWILGILSHWTHRVYTGSSGDRVMWSNAHNFCLVTQLWRHSHMVGPHAGSRTASLSVGPRLMPLFHLVTDAIAASWHLRCLTDRPGTADITWQLSIRSYRVVVNTALRILSN